MRFDNIQKLVFVLIFLTTFSWASLLSELQGTKGLADTELKSMVAKLDTIGFSTMAKNEHIENHYYNMFKEKNLDLLSFYTVADLKSLHELLLENPDFAAYAPFNLLAFKMPNGTKEGSDTTWYGHLATDMMLEMIGEKDEALKEKFKAMMAKLDTFLMTEMKPTESKKLTFDKALPSKPLLKMVKKIGDVDEIEEYVEEFIIEHDGLFVKNKFIIAGFLDVKFEYEDLDLDFEAYDAFWVSSLCHFEFSNAVFNHGDPQAGLFAPCSVYFYIPKGSGELHVGYAKVDNWLSSAGITDKDKIAYMEEISASVVRILGELGFKHTDATEAKVVKAEATLVEEKNKTKEAESNESILIEFYGTKGQPDAQLKSMVDNLGNIGFAASSKNEHLENHYFNTFKEKNIDLLNFYTIFDIESLRTLLLKNPDFGAYAPFNLLAYKKLASDDDSNTTWYGHLNPEIMLKIIGESDAETQDKFKTMMSKVDRHLKSEMKPTEHKILHFSKPLPKEPLLKMVKKIGDVDEIEEYVEEFIIKHDGLFVKNKFIIAGFLDVKFEYEDLDLKFDAYDAFWVSSLCHFEFSNTVFNHGAPHAAAFAPCSVYFYIPKGSGELHVGYASVDNWIATTGITDAKQIAYMQEISASIIRIFKELGFKIEGEEQKKIVEVPAKVESNVKTAEPINKNENSINIVIPSVPEVIVPIGKIKVPQPVKIVDSNRNMHDINDRSIKFSTRTPPNYVHPDIRYGPDGKGASLSTSTVMVGEVDKGRISTYLRGDLLSVEEVESKLKNAGFDVVSVAPLDKKKKLVSVVFTNDALKQLSAKENQGYLGTLRVLIDEKNKQISITNPLYLAKAFMQKDFDKEGITKILTALVDEFRGIRNSMDKLKFQLLPNYHFVESLPYFKDYIVVAHGENLKEKLADNKRVEYSFDLPNGATLVGVKLNKRIGAFINKIGTKNAGLLPYPLLIENGEAKILNPKYYISLMYPQLTMEEFMTIATIPDGIEADCVKVFK